MKRICILAATALLVTPLLAAAQAPASTPSADTPKTTAKAKKPSKLKKALSKPDRTNKPGENGTKQPQ